MLVDWNNTRIDYSAHSIHQLFEEQVTKSPDALAIEMYTMGGADGVALNKTLTYQQLNQKANQLAHYLKVLGVGPDVIVAVCMTRSPALVVALMGILKAGGAYLPTDPSYPKERLAFILKDSAATLLITEQDLSSNFAGNE